MEAQWGSTNGIRWMIHAQTEGLGGWCKLRQKVWPWTMWPWMIEVLKGENPDTYPKEVCQVILLSQVCKDMNPCGTLGRIGKMRFATKYWGATATQQCLPVSVVGALCYWLLRAWVQRVSDIGISSCTVPAYYQGPSISYKAKSWSPRSSKFHSMSEFHTQS